MQAKTRTQREKTREEEEFFSFFPLDSTEKQKKK